MTKQSLVIDCSDTNIPGQIGAYGRALNEENVQVKNFRPLLIKEHPRPVKDFYNYVSVFKKQWNLNYLLFFKLILWM
jgi:hypothetical protein